ncbi:unnamed protein product [Ambrosiozyma monospora]|uniref:Unnamed protein product n=1 Tax=Ambrosiozyma monospora TaxID=43982 RepID=A0ACB5T3F8_AMBMO|nr:unnamed protein product [Ambrosiozyma monospora]
MTSMVPPNAYQPGTVVTVGSHKVVITKYISQGGFAHVYICNISPPWRDQTTACLKRVAVPDKPTLNILRQEVDAMRRLEGKSHIVSYIDSNAARMPNGVGYEVFMLMEYCSGNGLIDFMNTRLVNKLTEPEILQIMGEITEGLAHMHALQPPLIHRDIKIENVLLTSDHHYMLCDFGSASAPLRPPQNVEEFQVLQDDIMKHTTPQYRAPEMLDLYRRQPIDEKSDIWAMGVFLYKLCYYTTPFEKNAINGNGNAGGGEYAILHGLYSFPPMPQYSARLKNMISKLLVVDPRARPNVFQLLEEVCNMRGVPFPNIYSASQIQEFTKKPAAINGFANVTPVTPIKPVIPTTQVPITMNNTIKPPYTEAHKPPLPARRDKTTGDIKKPLHSEGLHKSKSEKAMELTDAEIAEADPFTNVYKSSYTSGYPSSAKENNNSFAKPSLPVKPKPSIPYSALDSPKLRKKKPSTLKPRPISMSNADFYNLGSKPPASYENIINGLTKEEVVELSPSHHNNIGSSIDFLRSLSRQNTTSSIGLDNTGGSRRRFGRSSSNKRSSISSIKDLLTGGGRTGGTGTGGNGPRASSYGAGRVSSHAHNASSESLLEFAAINRRYELTPTHTSNLELIQDMSSPDTVDSEQSSPSDHRTPASLDIPSSSASYLHKKKPALPPTRPPKRVNSIQRRVHALLNRSNSPPPTKTAQGYGKYTDTKDEQSDISEKEEAEAEQEFKSFDMPPPQFNKVNKINVNGVPASIKSHHSSNKSNGSASSFSFPRSRPTSPPPSSSSATTSASLHKHTRTSSSTVKTATTSKSPKTTFEK